MKLVDIVHRIVHWTVVVLEILYSEPVLVEQLNDVQMPGHQIRVYEVVALKLYFRMNYSFLSMNRIQSLQRKKKQVLSKVHIVKIH